MSIPYYRVVEYIEDGVYSHQCLSCYTGISLFGCYTKKYGERELGYCPFCGIKFLGCKNAPEDIFTYEEGKEKRKLINYILEERLIIDGEVYRDWHLYYDSCCNFKDRKRYREGIVNKLKRLREEEKESIRKFNIGARNEYRVKIGEKDWNCYLKLRKRKLRKAPVAQR